jgi:hypothetical protein
MKFPIALLALLTNSGAYANQGIRGSTTQDLQLPKCRYSAPRGYYDVVDVDKGKTMVVNCKNGLGCYTFPGPLSDKCKFSDEPCVDFNDPATLAVTGGTVTGNGGECSLRCYECKVEVPKATPDSFNMITKE